MADHRLDDLIHVLASALAHGRAQGARAHLARLQARLGSGQTLAVSTLVDGQWQSQPVPLADLVLPRGVLATCLEVQIDCCLEELDGGHGALPLLALCPCTAPAEHLLTISLRGGTPIHVELLLDGQLLRTLSVDPHATAEN
ncbi:MAG: hypothetical protein ACREPC_16100 [Stenotrophomonas sp.]|uniref:hypothetical protein n=1 Tax=Stenotrophomonas sp. TaxID=69392 RepID=UPI003D6CCBB1